MNPTPQYGGYDYPNPSHPYQDNQYHPQPGNPYPPYQNNPLYPNDPQYHPSNPQYQNNGPNGYQGFNNNNSNKSGGMAAMCCPILTWMLICATCPVSFPVLLTMCCLQGTFPAMGEYMPPGLEGFNSEDAPDFDDHSGAI